MNWQRIYFNFKIGVEAILTNRFRALLTSLGIIFGVASVISMLAIGKGAEKEILEQIKQVGSNNIIIKTKLKNKDNNEEQASDKQQQKTSPGLTLKDAENIMESVSSIKEVSPEIEMETQFMCNSKKINGKLIGVTNAFFSISGTEVGEGKLFTDYQLENSQPVCIIGRNVKTKFFAAQSPIGQEIKCGKNWLKIVGILEEKNINDKEAEKLSIRNFNNDIYIPINSFLLRYKNRALVTIRDIKAAQNNREENKKTENPNYNQLDRLVINIKESGFVGASMETILKLLKRRHNGLDDFEIIVPELLLKQEQKTKNLFNTVLGIIASISLIVGGIGIMNIMLASVMERIVEIGLRLSLGATKKDILMQFVIEALSISLSGGIIGVIVGCAISYLIEQFTGIQTIVSVLSVFVSFTISIAVGLIFGIVPAKKASEQDPVTSLRSL